MEIEVFGQLTDHTGSTVIQLDDISNTEELLQCLYARYPSMATVRFVVAVDHRIVQDNQTLTGGEKLALLPPFSGG